METVSFAEQKSAAISLSLSPFHRPDMTEVLLDDGWIICDFTSFLIVFQSYKDDGRLIVKGCVQWNFVYGCEDFTSSEDRTRSARSVGQRLTH